MRLNIGRAFVELSLRILSMQSEDSYDDIPAQIPFAKAKKPRKPITAAQKAARLANLEKGRAIRKENVATKRKKKQERNDSDSSSSDDEYVLSKKYREKTRSRDEGTQKEIQALKEMMLQIAAEQKSQRRRAKEVSRAIPIPPAQNQTPVIVYPPHANEVKPGPPPKADDAYAAHYKRIFG
jgi:hypothetical protein